MLQGLAQGGQAAWRFARRRRLAAVGRPAAAHRLRHVPRRHPVGVEDVVA
jgi:hypothetical protein